jgi:hypothetical protein
MRRTRSTLVAGIAAIVTASGCCPIAWQGPYEGRITDANTGKPIPGAVIGAFWYRTGPWLGHDWVAAYDGQEAVTDEDGKFRLPGIHRLNLLPFSCIEDAEFTIVAEEHYGCGMISEHAEGGCGQPNVTLVPKTELLPAWASDTPRIGAGFERFVPLMLEVKGRSAATKGANPMHRKEDSPPWSTRSSPSSSSP